MNCKLSLILLLSLFVVGNNYAQEKIKTKKVILKGLVIDKENKPVENVSVFIDGKKLNAVTDSEGRFQIRIKPGVKSIAVFSNSNGVTEMQYNGEEEITFVLSTDNTVRLDTLNEPQKTESDQINVGYGSTSKRNLTTSVGEISKDKLRNSRNYANIFDMIKGEVAGVVVNGNSILIRGMSSFTLSNEPLFVVNGTPVSDISSISPHEVQSISILKGTSAAIYGSRGANGVILIRLKSGRDD